MLFPFQKYTSRREIDTSIFTSPWTAFLNSSIQTSPPPPRLLFTLVFRAIEPSRKMCSSVSSVRVGGKRGGKAFDLPNLIPTHERGKWTLEREFIHRITTGGTEIRRRNGHGD